MDLIELRAKAHNLDPILRIGKNGLTDNMIAEIAKTLKAKRLIKIKLLRSFVENRDLKAAAEEMAQKTKSHLVQQFGMIVVLYK